MTLLTRAHTVKVERIYDGVIFNVRVDTLKHLNNKLFKREIVEHNGGVVIACQPTVDEIILISQYRYAIDKEIIELPAGRVDAGEDRLLAAQRELSEETGYKAETWECLGELYSAPGFCNELLSFYRATDISYVGKNLDEDEEITVMKLTLGEAWQLVAAGKLQDIKTVTGLALLGKL